MSNDRIKVVGYSQRTTYQGGIEYRNFSPDLVGLQLASDGNTPLFTIGNFAVTTNLEPKRDKIFTTTKLSNFVTLADLGSDLSETLELLRNNAGVYLNLDTTKLNNYAQFGSLREFVRVALENIIINWPAALYIDKTFAIEPDFITTTGYTVQNYKYNTLTNTASFAISTNVINNQYEINYLNNAILQNTYNESNDLRNFTVNYKSYSLLYNDVEYDIVGYEGTDTTLNSFISITVNGNPFSSITNTDVSFYIKPNKIKENAFFNSLDDFENHILNRLVFPKYTALFNYSLKSENNGGIIYVSEILTWPTTDGYNLDYDTEAYNEYATKLLELSDNYDLSSGNLMVRFLVAESITDFDTTFVHLDPLHQETADQKMNKTLTIYGVEYDKINLFITNIKFANTVTYNNLDNTPDIYLKNLARVLGWELITSVLENNLLKTYLEPKDSTYSGQSIGLTLAEADIELWRRLILNTPWLWKSKGARKSIEFLFKFIGTPLGLIQFNEYVYLAENKIDIDGFVDVLELNNLLDDTGISKYPVDMDGYPNPLPDTATMYFQNDGLWYRETGGDNPNIDVTSGNNPHVGPYDGGNKYIEQFRKLIPNVTATTVTSETRTITSANIFTNYTLGTFTSYSGNTFVNITEANSTVNSNCLTTVTTITPDPRDRKNETDCGCPTPENLRSLSICINKKNQTNPCTTDVASSELVNPYGYLLFSYFQYNLDGSIFKDRNGSPVYYKSEFIDPFCCKNRGGVSYFYTKVPDLVLPVEGYLCCQQKSTCGCLVTCKRVVSQSNPIVTVAGNKYINFITENNTDDILSQDGCNCIGQTTKGILSTPVKLTLNGKSGFGCQLTAAGVTDMGDPSTSLIYRTYQGRNEGNVPCDGIFNVSGRRQNVTYVTVNLLNDAGSTVTNNAYTSPTQQKIGRVFEPKELTPIAVTGQLMIGAFNKYDNTTANKQLILDETRIRLSTRGQFGLTNITGDLELNSQTVVIPRMGYLISDVEITPNELLSKYNEFQFLESEEDIVQGTTTKYYYADFDFTSLPENVYIYMVYEYINIETYLKYAEAVGLTQSAAVP